MPAGPVGALQLTRTSGYETARIASRTGFERGECGVSGGGVDLGVVSLDIGADCPVGLEKLWTKAEIWRIFGAGNIAFSS